MDVVDEVVCLASEAAIGVFSAKDCLSLVWVMAFVVMVKSSLFHSPIEGNPVKILVRQKLYFFWLEVFVFSHFFIVKMEMSRLGYQ